MDLEPAELEMEPELARFDSKLLEPFGTEPTEPNRSFAAFYLLHQIAHSRTGAAQTNLPTTRTFTIDLAATNLPDRTHTHTQTESDIL